MSSEGSFRGQLLVAGPDLLDPNFHRTVVLLIEHGDQGTLGLVLNRPSDTTLKALMSQIGETAYDTEKTLHIGGPVPGPLMALHTHAELADSTVLPGIYFTVQKEHLSVLVERDSGTYHLFIGHAGWSPGQLEEEMRSGSWLLVPARLDLVFSEVPDLWENVRSEIVGPDLMSRLGIKHVPIDPRMN